MVLSKVIEKLVGHQIVDYIEFNQPLKQTIAKCCKGHSSATCTTLLHIKDDNIRAMKKGKLTFMVLANYYRKHLTPYRTLSGKLRRGSHIIL